MTNEERNALVEEYLPLVDRAIYYKKPHEKGLTYEEIEDMRQEMRIILMRLVERYDSSRGATLKTFIRTRLTFAVTDTVRAKHFHRERKDGKVEWLPNPKKIGGFYKPNDKEEYDAYSMVASKVSYDPEILEQLACQESIELFRNTLDPTGKIVLDGLLDGFSLRVCGERAGVSESRACQIRNLIKPHLLAYLKNKGYDLGE